MMAEVTIEKMAEPVLNLIDFDDQPTREPSKTIMINPLI